MTIFAATNNKSLLTTMNKIAIKGDELDVVVTVYVYLDMSHPDGDVYIAYCPSLNLVGYDHGEESARKDFEFVLSEYLKEQMSNNTLKEDLLAHGWKQYNHSDLDFDEPMPSDMISKDEHLEEVINTLPYSRINQSLAIPTYA